MTLIGLLLVNLKLNAQVEYFNEKNPRPEEVTLHPTMKNAHKGTNFSVDEVRLAHLKGLNSYVPIDVQNTFTIEKVRTMFSYYQPDVKDIDAWIVQNTVLGQDQNSWSEKTFSYLVSGPTPTTTILSGGYQSQKASGSQIGPKMIERMPYKRGNRGYTEDEQFLYLDLGKVCYLPEYQGVLVLWISLGCGNHVFPYTPPGLVVTQQVVQTQPVVEPQRAWGSDWVVSIEYYTVQQPLVQMPPQNYNYCGVSYQWGFNYNPCWWSPAVYYPTNCWGCTTYVPQQPITNNYYYEGDTYITNEGDQIINEGDVINEGDIVIVNNNNPPVDEGNDDDGSPVLGENGDNNPPTDESGNDDGSPNLGENGPNLGNNGEGTGNDENNNDGGGNLGGSGMIANNSDSKQTQKTVSFSEISPKVQSESEYWNSAKQSLLQKDATYAQNQSSTSTKPANWSVQNTSPTLGGNSTKQPAGTTSTKPANWNPTATTNPTVSGGKNPGTTARPQTTGTKPVLVRGNSTSSTTYKPSQNTTVQRGNGGANTSSTSGKLNTGNYQTSNNSATTSQGSNAMKGSSNYSGGKVSGGNTGGMRSSGGGSRGSVGGGSRGGRR